MDVRDFRGRLTNVRLARGDTAGTRYCSITSSSQFRLEVMMHAPLLQIGKQQLLKDQARVKQVCSNQRFDSPFWLIFSVLILLALYT